MVVALALLSVLQSAPDADRRILVSYECSRKLSSDERTCGVDMTVSPATAGDREVSVRYECRVRRSVRCILRSREPRDAWARDHAAILARRFEAGGLGHSLLDNQRFQFTFRFPENGAGPPDTPVAE